VPSLVVLAGRLAGYAETMGYVWPADTQRHCVVDECCKLGVEFLLVQPCPGDPIEDLGGERRLIRSVALGGAARARCR